MAIETTCHLCHRERKLVRSHILSELLWRPVYGPDGKAVSARLDLPYDRRLGRGVREPLLCAECEEKLGRYEDYFGKLWYGRAGFPAVLPREGVQRKVDYARFKLFHLANLWRAHESTLPEFRHVQLGRAAERIRQALHDGVARPFSEFPIAAQAVINPIDNRVLHELLAMPVRFRINRGWVYAPLYAGCLWYIGVSPDVLADNPTVLQENGNIVIPAVSLRRLPRIAEIMFRNRAPRR